MYIILSILVCKINDFISYIMCNLKKKKKIFKFYYVFERLSIFYMYQCNVYIYDIHNIKKNIG